MKIYFPFLLLSILFALGTHAEESRTWTDTKGKTVIGTPSKKTATSITITLENGQNATIPLSKLSQEDRDFVSSWTLETTNTPSTNKKSAPAKKKSGKKDSATTANFDKPWPQLIKGSPMPEVTLVKEDGDSYTYETEHFTFISDAKLSLKLMRTVAAMFESTFEANCELPFNFPCLKIKTNPKEKYHAIFYKDKEDFLRATSRSSVSNVAGVYIFKDGAIHVPFSSMGVTAKGNEYTIGRGGDPHTVIHELTHQMSLPSMQRPDSPMYPIWFSEGVAEYLGYTPYKSGIINFKQTKQFMVEGTTEFGRKNGGGRNIGKDFTISSLQKFINQTQAEFTGSDPQLSYGFSSLLFYYFCHIDGKGDGARIKNYVRAFQDKKSPAEANDLLLDGRTWEELANDVATGMKKNLRLKPTINP